MQLRGLFAAAILSSFLCGCMHILRGAAELVPDTPQTVFVKNLPLSHSNETLGEALAKSDACKGKNAHWDQPEDNVVRLTCRQGPGNRIVFYWTVSQVKDKQEAKLTDVRVSAPTQKAFVGLSAGSQTAAALLRRLLANEPLLTDEFVRDQLPGF